jgi:uncharacterized protein YdeI (YjbR/CyaY-like superfamily)
MNSKVDAYISELQKWKQELEQLRAIVLDCGLVEELKWGTPCYMFQKNNIILLGAFKDFCIISFLKGALLNDAESILTKMGENTQAARVVKFTSVKEIKKLQAILKTYIFEAVEIEKAGLKVEPKKHSEYTIPEELQNQFKQNSDFKKAFDALTPGRQRGYLLYFSDSKQSKTREARIEKYMSRIMKGKGLNDCVCGLSKKMPNCDGSHKFLKP